MELRNKRRPYCELPTPAIAARSFNSKLAIVASCVRAYKNDS
jgi:hypothetical protein